MSHVCYVLRIFGDEDTGRRIMHFYAILGLFLIGAQAFAIPGKIQKGDQVTFTIDTRVESLNNILKITEIDPVKDSVTGVLSESYQGIAPVPPFKDGEIPQAYSYAFLTNMTHAVEDCVTTLKGSVETLTNAAGTFAVCHVSKFIAEIQTQKESYYADEIPYLAIKEIQTKNGDATVTEVSSFVPGAP